MSPNMLESLLPVQINALKSCSFGEFVVSLSKTDEIIINLYRDVMKKERLHLLFVLLALPWVALAGPRSFQQAKKIAERQAAQLGIVMDETAVSQAKSVGGSTASGVASAYYVFPNGEDKGFTIVSGDDRLPEIVGYASHGTYDSANMPANYVGFMKAYQEMVQALEKGDATVTRNLAEVKALRSEKTTNAVVEPLLGDIAWNQTAPYNNMCPKYDGTNRAATGCVATAMAQVMKYYGYPTQLKADIPQYTSVGAYGNVTVPAISTSEGTYDWNNMLSVYGTSNYTEMQANAVAKLMYHCGAAVKMVYGPESSANVTSDILAKYFGYDADLMLDLTRSAYSLAEWTQIMDNELAAHRPILYCGQSSGGGHQFVCDGSDANGLYHINWGWGGYQDGYFDVTILNPEKGGVGSGNATDGYNRSCSMIVGIAPDNGQVDEPVASFTPIAAYGYEGYTSIDITQSARSDASGTFGVKITSFFTNQGHDAVKASLAFGILQDGNYVPVSSVKNEISFDGISSDGQISGSIFEFDFNYAFPVGKTTLYAIYSTDGVNWKKCSYVNLQPYVVEATAQSLSLVKSQLSAEVSAEDQLLGGMANTFKVTITNDGDFDFLGDIDIYSNTTNTKPDQATSQLYVCVPAHSTVTRTMELTPATGNLYLWLADGEVVLVNGQKFTVAASSAPVLTVVKAWSNATPDVYETENAIYNKDSKVKAPKVEDDKAVFNYSIKNDGGTATIRYAFYAMNGESMSYSYSPESIRLPGGGAVTTITKEFTPEEVGCRTMCSGMLFYDGITCKSSLDPYNLYLADNPDYYYTMGGSSMVVYVAGKATGISSVSATSYIRGGKGEIVILSDTSKRLSVYNLNGQKVADVQVEAGVQQNLPLTSGLYVVDGKKIVVK